MTDKKIKEYIKKAHDNSIKKGFYDCPECNKEPRKRPCNHIGCYSHMTHPCEGCGRLQGNCVYCNGSGIDPNSNIGEKLMLIISEFGEALEAHRKNNFTDIDQSDSLEATAMDNDWIKCFERFVKDTFEDEIAGVFIRLFDLCGYLGIDLKKDDFKIEIPDNMGEALLYLVINCTEIYSTFKETRPMHCNYFFTILLLFCEKHDIDIEKHIDLKMSYNKIRPRKHGKEY